MATNLEQWNPNIKSPGQQSPGGAYRNPEAVIPDWRSITAGWQNMQKSIVSGVKEIQDAAIAKAEKIEKEEKERQEKNAAGAEAMDYGAARGIDKKNGEMITDYYEQRQEYWRKSIEDGGLGLGSDAGWGDLSIKQRDAEARKMKQIGGAKNALEMLGLEWHKNNDIDYSRLIDSPKTMDFLNQMFKTPGSMHKIDEQNGVMGVFYTTKDGEEEFMELSVLIANVGVWKDASVEKDKQWDKIEKIVAPHRKKISDIQKLVANGGITKADGKAEIKKLTQDLQRQLIGKQNPDTGIWESGQGIFAGEGYGYNTRKFLHHNFLGEDKRYLKTDFENEERLPDGITTIGEDNINSFNVDFMEFVNTAFNVVEDPTLFAPDIPSITPTAEQLVANQDAALLKRHRLTAEDISPSGTAMFSRVMRLANILFKSTTINKPSDLTDVSLPTEGKKYNLLQKAWGEKPLTSEKLREIVEEGLEHDDAKQAGEFSRKEEEVKVYKIWKKELQTSTSADMGKNQSLLDELLNFSSRTIKGKLIQNATIKKVNGKTFVVLWYPTGSVTNKTQSLAPMDFDISNETGRENLFAALMGGSRDSTKTNNLFKYYTYKTKQILEKKEKERLDAMNKIPEHADETNTYTTGTLTFPMLGLEQ